MVVEMGEFSAYTSDRQNAFEWEILVFKGKESVAILHSEKKPTKADLEKILKGYVSYGV
jgi:hypothetical protein